MINDEINKMYDEAIRLWGEESQINMMIEECSELIKALCKNKRRPKSFEILYNICEEIIDVDIVLGQMKRIFNFGDQANRIREEKLMNLKRKIDRYKESEDDINERTCDSNGNNIKK
jgi:hypothetical protein